MAGSGVGAAADGPPAGRLRLLGPARLETPGQAPEPLRAERAHQLLVLLAMSPDPQPRERLATLFWPEHNAGAARRNLRKALFRLRAQTSASALREPGGLLACAIRTDVQAFEQALDSGRRREALALWAGTLCDGLEAGAGEPFVQWLQAERQRLTQRRRAAMLALAGESETVADAVALARTLLAEDALDEPALQMLMSAALRGGDHTQALRDYAEFEGQLRSQLGVEPSAATRALRERLAQADRPIAARADAARGWPGASAEPDFVGRRAELRELLGLVVAADAHWISLVGPGGIGKTRLLRHALPQAAAQIGAEPVWIGCDDLAAGASLLPRTAQALGLPWPGTGTTAPGWNAALQGRRIVLALDNLEHLAAGAAALGGVLQGCPGVLVIASSRERLGLPGEWLLPLAGLPWPQPEDMAEGLADAGRFDAVRLFEQAARAVQPRLDLQAERAAVAALCAAVQGLPLALKLAAAWTRYLGMQDILRAIAQGGELLHTAAGPAGLADARPGGLGAVFAQSWARLVPAEQAALLALACCRGGFDAEAARAIAGAGWPVLAALLDKSLVQRHDSAAGAPPRFELHPLLQQWLLDRADARCEVGRERHAQHYLGWLAGLPPGARAPARRAMLVQARLEQENLRAAWLQALRAADVARLAAATLPLMAVWLESGQMADGLALLDAAEALLPEGDRRGTLDGARAVLLLPLARYRECEQFARRALKAARRSGNVVLQRGALSSLGSALLMLGHGAPARRCIEQALALARRAGDRPAVAHFLWKLSMQDYAAGALDRAEAEVTESIALHEEAGHVPLGLRNNLANLRHLRGDHAGARAAYEPALAQAVASQDPARRHLEYNLALLSMDEGDAAQAAERLAPLMQQLGDGVQAELLAMGWLLQMRLELHAGRNAAALAAVQAAGRDALARQSLPMMASALLHGAMWRHAAGDAEGALAWAEAACATPALVYMHRLLAQQTLQRWGRRRPDAAALPTAAEPALRAALAELMRCA